MSQLFPICDWLCRSEPFKKYVVNFNKIGNLSDVT